LLGSSRVWYICYVSKLATIDVIQDGGVATPRGYFSGAAYAGLKKPGPDVLDLAVLYSEKPAAAAAVFTRSRIKAAPVILDMAVLRAGGKIRALAVNSGCANACTGPAGMASARATASALAKNLGIDPKEALVASTGVIGVQLPMDKIAAGLAKVALSRDSSHEFTRAIMTTDTRPKEIALEVKLGESRFILGGTAKGAGMIHPDMATMLCFITCDAAVEARFLQACLKRAVADSFNMITVDGDTSTNDTVLVLANGAARSPAIDAGSDLGGAFQDALNRVCLFLAKSVARDGEGATRMIEVQVKGARNLRDARVAARTIAGSPLVKTAVHGCDPNWGRIVAAAGRSGAEMEESKTDCFFGDMCLLRAGIPQEVDKNGASALLNLDTVRLGLDLHLGRGKATAWGCDLSEEYVVINSEYTT
jgi:glutamate N-acetyltransferase / amino-acid N-acetyltransferase